MNKKGNKCFQYAVTVTLNHKEIKKDSLRITKIKPFTNKYILLMFQNITQIVKSKFFF